MPKPPRSSVRLVRRREATRAALAADEDHARDTRISAGQSQFLDGVEYMRRGIRSGKTADQALDLAATPADRRPRAFLDGANAARALYASTPDPTHYARRAYAAYGLPAPERETTIAARNLENEIAWVARNMTRR